MSCKKREIIKKGRALRSEIGGDVMVDRGDNRNTGIIIREGDLWLRASVQPASFISYVKLVNTYIQPLRLCSSKSLKYLHCVH